MARSEEPQSHNNLFIDFYDMELLTTGLWIAFSVLCLLALILTVLLLALEIWDCKKSKKKKIVAVNNKGSDVEAVLGEEKEEEEVTGVNPVAGNKPVWRETAV